MNTEAQATPVAAPTVKIAAKKSESPLDKVLGLLSSVRFGLVMLGLLLTCCMIGMIVRQINVEGFQKYLSVNHARAAIDFSQAGIS